MQTKCLLLKQVNGNEYLSHTQVFELFGIFHEGLNNSEWSMSNHLYFKND